MVARYPDIQGSQMQTALLNFPFQIRLKEEIEREIKTKPVSYFNVAGPFYFPVAGGLRTQRR